MPVQIIIKSPGNFTLPQMLQTLRLLSPDEKKQFFGIRNKSRKKQWLLTRFILYKLKKISQKIQYSATGKPLIDCCDISVSHTVKLVAVALSDKPVGVDLEQTDRNFYKISAKYVSDKDENILSGEHLALLWTAKEAIYKLYSCGGLSFKDRIFVRLPEQLGSYGKFNGEILLNSRQISISLSYYRLKGHFLTIAQYKGNESKV